MLEALSHWELERFEARWVLNLRKREGFVGGFLTEERDLLSEVVLIGV